MKEGTVPFCTAVPSVGVPCSLRGRERLGNSRATRHSGGTEFNAEAFSGRASSPREPDRDLDIATRVNRTHTLPDKKSAGKTDRARALRHLRELIAALDRRVPHIEGTGELAIARDAATLRTRALNRIAQLEVTGDR